MGITGPDTAFTTTDGNLTFTVKNYPGPAAGDHFIVSTGDDPNTPDKNYRGYGYLMDHLAKNGYASVSISLENFILIENFPSIDGRTEALKETIAQLSAGTGVPDVVATKLDFKDVSLIGHSRGGEVVTTALKASAGWGMDLKRGVSIAPTRATAVPDITDKKDLLVIYGAYDSDVDEGSPFRMYDNAVGRKHCVFVDKANHSFFNTSWALDEGGGKLDILPADKVRHLEVAKAYILAFLLDSHKERHEYREFFTRDTGRLKPPSVSTAAAALSIQSLPPETRLLAQDRHDGVPALNTMGGAVTGENLTALLDIQADETTVPRGFYQDTFLGVVEFSVAPPILPSYRSESAAGTRVLDRSFLSLRASQQDNHASNPRTNLNITLGLEDAAGVQSFMELEAFHILPPSYERQKSGVRVAGEPHKSHFKTLRLPLAGFATVESALDLDRLSRVRLVFDQPRGGLNQGAVGLDDLVFEE